MYLPYCLCSLPWCLDLDIFGEDVEEQLVFADTMVCTGCCATLDHIVTYLFKKVTNKGGCWTAGAQSHKEWSLSKLMIITTYEVYDVTMSYNNVLLICSNLTVGKKVRGSQTSAENDPLVAVIKVIMVWFKCPQLLIYLCKTSTGSMIKFQIHRWGPKFSSKCSRLCWILSCLRTAGCHSYFF